MGLGVEGRGRRLAYSNHGVGEQQAPYFAFCKLYTFSKYCSSGMIQMGSGPVENVMGRVGRACPLQPPPKFIGK